MNRRRYFLYVALMSPLSWLAGSTYVAQRGGQGQCGVTGSEFKSCLLGLFGDLDSPRIIGKRYLDLYPLEKQSTMHFAMRMQLSGSSNVNALKELIARERENDFLTEDIVIIDGWLLSRTVVQVCALTVLL